MIHDFRILLCLLIIINSISDIRSQDPCNQIQEVIDSLFWQHQYPNSELLENCSLTDEERTSISVATAAIDLNVHRYDHVRDQLTALTKDTLLMSAGLKARFHCLEGELLLDETKFDQAILKLNQADELFVASNQKNTPWHYKNKIALIRYAALIHRMELGDSIISEIKPSFENNDTLPASLSCSYWLAKGIYQGQIGEKSRSIRSYLNVLNLSEGKPELYPLKGEALYQIGITYVSKFEQDSARTFLLESQEVLRNANDTLNETFSSVLDQLGVAHYYKGEYQKTLPLMLRAFEIIEQVFGPDHEAYGSLTSNLSVVYDKLGQYERSLEYVEKSLLNTELVYGKQHSLYYTTLNNYGLALTRLKRYPEAKSAFLQVLSMMEEDGSAESSRYGLYLDNLGRVYLRTNMLDSAEYCYTRAVENALKHNGKNHYYYIIRKNNLAGLYSRQGKLSEALEIYKELIEPTRTVFGVNHPQYGIRLSNLGSAYEELGDYENASAFYKESTENLIDQFYNYYPTLSEVDKIEYINSQRDWIDRLFSFTQHGDYYDSGGFLQDLNLAIKGLALGSHVTIRQTPGNKEVLQRWNIIRTQIGDLHTKAKNAELLDSLKNLITESEKLEIELLSNYPHDFHLKKLTYNDIQSNLKKGELAIDFFHFQFMNGLDYVDTILYGALLNKAEWLHPKVVIIGSEEELIDALQDFHGNNQTAKLTDLIWEPLKDHLEPVIFLSPSGLLNKVPFQILKSKRGSFAFTKHQLHFFQNMRDFINWKSSSKIELESLILFGNPNFNLDPTFTEQDSSEVTELKKALAATTRNIFMNSARGLNGFSPLPGTAREIRQISEIAIRNDLDVSTFVEDKASEQSFKNLNKTSGSVVHIATHGFFLNQYQVEESLQNNSRNLLLNQPDPMLRSGLALAGVNHLWLRDNETYDGEDGILTAYEISNLDLFDTQLVVLSACETGLGDLRNAEGVYGLQRAFRQAGVKQLIISLWKVPDQETAELMKTFYTKLVKSGDAHQALSETQKKMSKKYSPFFWAGFMLIE